MLVYEKTIRICEQVQRVYPLLVLLDADLASLDEHVIVPHGLRTLQTPALVDLL